MASYAFVVPVLQGKTEAVRRLAAEASEGRRSEIEEFQRRSLLSHGLFRPQEDGGKLSPARRSWAIAREGGDAYAKSKLPSMLRVAWKQAPSTLTAQQIR